MSRSRPPAYLDRRFTVHDVLDPRWLQLSFAVAFLFSMGLLVVGGSTLAVGSILGAATGLCLAVTALTLVLPWRRLPRLLGALVPACDIATLGLSSLDGAGWAVAPLLVLPVLWMGGSFHRIGALGAGLAAVLFFGIPNTFYLGTGGARSRGRSWCQWR